MKPKLTKIFLNTALFGVTLGAIGKIAYGGTDREAAETTLVEQGYEVIEYKGKPGFFRQNQTCFYEDEFIVRTPNGRKTEVIVGRNPITHKAQLFFK